MRKLQLLDMKNVRFYIRQILSKKTGYWWIIVEVRVIHVYSGLLPLRRLLYGACQSVFRDFPSVLECPVIYVSTAANHQKKFKSQVQSLLGDKVTLVLHYEA